MRDSDYWRNYWRTVWSPDYLRWRRRRRWVRLGLIALTMLLLAPVELLAELFQVQKSTWFFFVLLFCVLFLLAIYRMLGWIGRPYCPPAEPNPPGADASRPIIMHDPLEREFAPPLPGPAERRSGCQSWLMAVGIFGLLCVLGCGGLVALVVWKVWDFFHHRHAAPRFGQAAVYLREHAPQEIATMMRQSPRHLQNPDDL
jgi:hypothetical protein